MKTKMTGMVIKNIVFSIILIFPLSLSSDNYLVRNYLTSNHKPQSQNAVKIILIDKDRNYCNTECILIQNRETIDFISNTLGIEKNHIIDNLIKLNAGEIPIVNNIGRITDKFGNVKRFNSFTEGLIEYTLMFSKENKKLVSNKSIPFKGNTEYIINLIKFFTEIYDNVDYTTAVSIAAAESGDFKVKYMLDKNNIYGGLNSQGLIKYKTIEYGVLSYIRMLSKNYYGRGLKTIEEIGKVYCPEYKNGKKIASEHWVNLVTKYVNKYDGTYSKINVYDLKNE